MNKTDPEQTTSSALDDRNDLSLEEGELIFVLRIHIADGNRLDHVFAILKRCGSLKKERKEKSASCSIKMIDD